MIDRVVHLGFEVRVELTLDDGGSTWVQTTRGRARGARAHGGRHRLAAAAGLERRTSATAQASGDSVSRLTRAGMRPATTSASVISSSTERMLARKAIQTT